MLWIKSNHEVHEEQEEKDNVTTDCTDFHGFMDRVKSAKGWNGAGKIVEVLGRVGRIWGKLVLFGQVQTGIRQGQTRREMDTMDNMDTMDRMDEWGRKKEKMEHLETIIPKHGGYRKLKSFQIAQLVYDITLRFTDRYIDSFSRSRDQMIQAARSGVQNIAEGSQASGTSKKTELKLTKVARASLEELRLDYEDFLRQRGLCLWPQEDPRRKELVSLRPVSADDVAEWIKKVFKNGQNGHDGRYGQDGQKDISKLLIYAEISCNAVLVLIGVASSLLDRQLAAQAEAFKKEGGFSERLYRVRSAARNGRRG